MICIIDPNLGNAWPAKNDNECACIIENIIASGNVSANNLVILRGEPENAQEFYSRNLKRIMGNI